MVHLGLMPTRSSSRFVVSRQRAAVHSAVCVVNQPVQREDLSVRLVLAHVRGDRDHCQLPGVDCEVHLLHRQTQLHQETSQIYREV